MDGLRSAQKWGVPPLTMFWREATTWSQEDRFLAQALDLHERDLCPGGCGQYLDQTSEEDGFHEVHTVVCDACAARDRHNRDSERREPGELVYVVREG